MSSENSQQSTLQKPEIRFLLPALAVALIVRVLFFNGISLFDDVNYWMQSIATGLGNSWPPLATHRHTRIGLILPCALLWKIFGLKAWVPYIFTMLGGLLEVAFAFYVSRHFFGERTARLTTWLAVFFPLNLLYSTYIFPDLWVGLLGAMSLFCWYRALESDSAKYYALASVFFGLAWLVRETILMCWLVYMLLWIHAGRWRRPKVLWAFVPALLILGTEFAVYAATTGNWQYRLHAILTAHDNPTELATVTESVAGGGFWLDPVFEVFFSHELGLFMIGGLLAGALALRQKAARPLALWLLAGFAWSSWGTMAPTHWVHMQRDPRYLAVLGIPALALLANYLAQIKSPLWRRLLLGMIIASGLVGPSIDLGRTKLSAHRKFVASEYNSAETALEPYTYFGARVVQNFGVENAHYTCVKDLGRKETVQQIPFIPGASLVPHDQAHYLVFPKYDYAEKWKNKTNEGWKIVAEIPGETRFMRRWVARSIATIMPSQKKRAEGAMKVPALLVLENPKFQKK